MPGETEQIQELVDKLVSMNMQLATQLEREMGEQYGEGRFYDEKIASRIDDLTRSSAAIMDKAERLIKAKARAAANASLEEKLRAAIKFINDQEPSMRAWCKGKIQD